MAPMLNWNMLNLFYIPIAAFFDDFVPAEGAGNDDFFLQHIEAFLY